jgi:hypothetical protein
MAVCGIKHGFGDQICVRTHGHDGLCRSRAVRGSDGTITYSEWESRGGKFYRHVEYRTICPANARREEHQN